MSLLDIFEDPNYILKRDAFHVDLNKIEEKYSYWFKDRPGIFEWQEHDKLGNHYTIYKNENAIHFFFGENTPVPQMIVDECQEAFAKHFGPKEQS